MNVGTSVPRLTCSGTSWNHDEAFLSIATADPLVMRCVICGRVEHVETGESA